MAANLCLQCLRLVTLKNYDYWYVFSSRSEDTPNNTDCGRGCQLLQLIQHPCHTEEAKFFRSSADNRVFQWGLTVKGTEVESD